MERRQRPMTIEEFHEHTGRQREDFHQSLPRYLLLPQEALRVALAEQSLRRTPDLHQDDLQDEDQQAAAAAKAAADAEAARARAAAAPAAGPMDEDGVGPPAADAAADAGPTNVPPGAFRNFVQASAVDVPDGDDELDSVMSSVGLEVGKDAVPAEKRAMLDAYSHLVRKKQRVASPRG